MATYSREDMLRMQEDALKRVREMQRRAQETVRSSGETAFSETQPAPEEQPRQKKAPCEPPPANTAASPLAGWAQKMLPNMDEDGLLLLCLLLLLQREQADTPLVLALLYILF